VATSSLERDSEESTPIADPWVMCSTGSVHAGLTHGLSRMTGNCHVRFLGEGAAAMPFPYPTPHGWGAENASTIGGCSEGRAEHLSLKGAVKLARQALKKSTEEIQTSG
jgi:hypothetical protein